MDKTKLKQEMHRVDKRLSKSTYTCLVSNCSQSAINSHLFQRNGVLNQITKNGHFYEFKPKSIFELNPNENPFSFKRKGINEGFSYPLFCSYHDDLVFKPIERTNSDFFSYHSQLLLAYRTTCTELRKKEMQGNRFRAYIDDAYISKAVSNEVYSRWDSLQFGYNIAAIELENQKVDIERDLSNNTNEFSFWTFNFKKKEICINTLFSSEGNESNNLLSMITPESNVYCNIFPFNNKTIAVVGYQKSLTNEWISNYINKFSNFTEEGFEIEVSNLISGRTETFVLSENLLQSISKTNQNRLAKIILDNVYKFGDEVNTSFNIFQNS